MTNFDQLGLCQPLLLALGAKGYTVPTPIQAQAIPIVLEGRDLCGIAQTGTGKTAAFMLPSLQRLADAKRVPKPGQIRMLVLAPTRELASQIAASAEAYGKEMRASVGVIFGGTAPAKSLRTVSRGLDVLVATPGRLLDLVDQRAVNLSELEILVLDEADQMLDLGFIHALKRIVQLVPKNRQTLFFSATMPKTIQGLAAQYLRDPAQVSVAPIASTAERVEQSVTFVNAAEKAALLTLFFQNTKIDRSLVFSRTKHGADKVVRLLEAAGINANAIHGNKSQPQRERALAAFKSGDAPILVATDIAARGIDIPGVSHVINYDLPNVPEQYVHRIGRTARAGADGIAIAYCADDERPYLKDIEKLTRQRIAIAPLPEGFMEAVKALKALKPAARDIERGERPARGPGRHAGRERAPGGRSPGGRGHERDPQRLGLPRNDPRSDMPQPAHSLPRASDRRPAASHPQGLARPTAGVGSARPEGQRNDRVHGAGRPQGAGQGRPQGAGGQGRPQGSGGDRRPGGGGGGRGRPSGSRFSA
jgi:ATP-dependent RNA helicase RhlE